jgi:cytochrome c oxidase assembly protein subunit 11
MIGVAYAPSPLYTMFCQLTGYGGTTQRVEQYSDRILDQEITVRFDANVGRAALGLPAGAARHQDQDRRDGADRLQGRQPLRRADRRPATFNVTPELAGAYFNKVECFCFTDTTLKPGETLDMPVVFYVDPDIVDVPELKHRHDHAVLHILPDRG